MPLLGNKCDIGKATFSFCNNHICQNSRTDRSHRTRRTHESFFMWSILRANISQRATYLKIWLKGTYPCIDCMLFREKMCRSQRTQLCELPPQTLATGLAVLQRAIYYLHALHMNFTRSPCNAKAPSMSVEFIQNGLLSHQTHISSHPTSF